LSTGNTIPFIARYCKEATQCLDEIALRAIKDALERSKALNARKTTVLKTFSEQGLLYYPTSCAVKFRLRVRLQLEGTCEISELRRRLVHNRQFEFCNELPATVDDCFQRLLLPATESTVLQTLKEEADEQAIGVFGENGE